MNDFSIGDPSSRVEAGPEIRINCPACGAAGAAASTYNQIDRARVVVVPVTWRTSWVVCSACRKHLHCSRDVRDLPGLSAEELTAVISPYVPLVSRTFAVLSLVLGCVPFIGAVLALVAVLANRRPGPWRLLSRLGLGVTVVAHAVLGVILLKDL